MPAVNVHEAKTQLSKLIGAIESGAEAEIVISRNGKPIVKMVPVESAKPVRRLGLGKGKFTLDYDAFKALDAEVARLFEESADPFGERLTR